MKKDRAKWKLWRELFLADEQKLSAARIDAAVDELVSPEVKPSLSPSAALGSFYSRNGIERPEYEEMPKKGPKPRTGKLFASLCSGMAVLLLAFLVLPAAVRSAEKEVKPEQAEPMQNESSAWYWFSDDGSKEYGSELVRADGLRQLLHVSGSYGQGRRRKSFDSSEINDDGLALVWFLLQEEDVFHSFPPVIYYCTDKTADNYEIELKISYQRADGGTDEADILFICDTEADMLSFVKQNDFLLMFRKMLEVFQNPAFQNK